DDWYPDEVEQRHDHAEAFGTQPVQPAEAIFALLVGRQPAPSRQEVPPVLLDDLETAIGPAVTLLLEGLVGVGQQALAVAVVGVVRSPAELLDRKAEIAVLADRVE